MKNSKQLCRLVSKQLNIPEKEVTEEYSFIMTQLKNTLIGLKGSVMLFKVGSFNINYSKLKKNILFTIKKIRFYRDSPRCRTAGIKRQLILDSYVEMLQRLLKERDKQAIHRVQLRKYYAQKKAKRLAKQAQNGSADPKGRKAWTPPRFLDHKTKS